MKKNLQTENFFESFDLVLYLYKRKYILIILTAIAAIASVIASLMITTMFKSSVIFFPAAVHSVSRSLLSESTQAADPMAFGSEEDVE